MQRRKEEETSLLISHDNIPLWKPKLGQIHNLPISK